MMLRIQRMICYGALLFGPLPAWAGANASSKELQSLVNDTAKQLQLSYRHNLTESHARHEQVRHVIAAWKAAPRTDANNQLLTQWLRQTIRNSMPGSREPLLAIPEFDRLETRTAVTTSTAPESQEEESLTESPAPPDTQSGDPFRDDPGQDKPLASVNSAKK